MASEDAVLLDGDAQLIADREKERSRGIQGFCCACCSLRTELWIALALDVLTLLAAVSELPQMLAAPSETGFLFWGLYFVLAVVIPSLSFYLYALRSRSGVSRLALCRFLCYKGPVAFLMHLYFFVGPWATPVCTWMCQTNYQGVQSLGTGDACMRNVAIVQFSRGAFYALYSMYMLYVASEFMQCHPANDGKGIWGSSKSAGEEPAADASPSSV